MDLKSEREKLPRWVIGLLGLLIVLVVFAVVGATQQRASEPSSGGSASTDCDEPRGASGPGVHTLIAFDSGGWCHQQNGVVAVWRDQRARETGQAMVEAGLNRTNPAALIPYVSCVVPDGTPVTIIGSAGLISDDIVIAGGPNQGCTGNVIRQHVQ